MLYSLRLFRSVAFAALCALPSSTAAQGVPAPDSHLGFQVGADRKLADWSQIVAYFGKLAAASPAVKLETLGPTTQDRPFILVTVSSPENMVRLEAIRSIQAKLADPRSIGSAEEERIVATQPVVLLISCNIHATEIASSQMAMELAYRLATNDTLKNALKNVVVLLVPSMNPDGQDMVTDWYRKNLGTKWEGGSLPWLYHHYVGHDNNRDWYMVTQKETRLVTDLLYRRWYPEIFYDVHQQGDEGMRLTIPPFVDPINPNVDALIVRGINHIGMEMALALEERGKSGVGDGATYDLWWHGGARSTPTRHNMVGLLSEAASVRIATPITQDTSKLRGHERGLPEYERRMNFPNPWPGGVWRLRDIVEYELIAAEALVNMASQQRGQYVRNFVKLGRKAVRLGETQPPYAYVIPAEQHDPTAADRLVEVLRIGGVEVERASANVTLADKSYGPGSFVVRMAQPYRAHAKDLLEVQRFPRMEKWPGGPVERPYDVAGWTLPLQMGVRVVPVNSPLLRAGFQSVSAMQSDVPVTTCETLRGSPNGVLLDARDTKTYTLLARSLAAGARVQVTARGFVVERAPRNVAGACRRGAGGMTIRSLSTITRMPRIGLYRGWTANMDEGWTRWVLERFDIPFTSVPDSIVKAGNLRDHFDVLLVSDMSLRELRDGMSAEAVPPPYSGGIGPGGIESIAGFVKGGGTLVLLGRSAELATQALGVPVKQIVVPARQDDWYDDEFAGRPDSARQQRVPLYAPGSILRVLMNLEHSVARGMPDTAAVYFTNSVSFDAAAGSAVRVIARYPERTEDILLSGYLQGGEAIAGKAAAVEAKVGDGRVVMFGFRPQYRGQSYGTFKMLFNALLAGGDGKRGVANAR
ncbi:MAG: M14 family zinc carboxypeptidase [Gemmatimonadaceae bacterium]